MSMFRPSAQKPSTATDAAARAAALPALSLLTLWTASVFATVLGFSRLSYGLLLPALRESLGGSYTLFGMIGTINFIGYLLGILLTPLLAARSTQRLPLTTGSLVLMSGAMIGAAFSSSLLGLALWRFVVGFSSAPATVLTMAITLERINPRERGFASGLVWMGGAAGIVVSGLIAPFALAATANWGWRWTWAAMGLAGLICALGFATTRAVHGHVPTPDLTNAASQALPAPQAALPSALRAALDPKQLLFLALAYGLFGGGYIIYFTFVVSWLVQQGLSAQYTGFAWAAIGIMGMASGVAWGKAIDRWPRGATLAASLALGAVGTLAILSGSVALTAVGGALVGLCAFIAPPLLMTALLRRAVSDAAYTAHFSVITACFAFGQLLGPLIGGVVIEYFGLPLGIASSGLLLGIGALAAWRYDRSSHYP